MKTTRPFRLGTTSFILPDHIIPNVKALGPHVDEIELLVFESQPETVLPSNDQIQTLQRLAAQFDLTYNVHLPLDISLSKGSEDERQQAIDALLKTLDRVAPLDATTHTLHLEMPDPVLSDTENTDRVNGWRDQMELTLDRFLGQLNRPERLTIETLNYDFSIIEPVVRSRHLPICIDIGHGIKYGYDWLSLYRTDPSMVPLVHLHGVTNENGRIKDHQGLGKMLHEQRQSILSFLETYTGTVSLEVFNQEDLVNSLAYLSDFFQPIPDIKTLNIKKMDESVK